MCKAFQRPYVKGFDNVKPKNAILVLGSESRGKVYAVRCITELLKEKKAIVLLNKSDLTPVVTVEMLQKKTSQPIIPISARMEQGVDRLEEKIREMFFQGDISFNDEVYITNVRHKNALEDAYASLTMVENSIAMEMPEDFFSIDLMSAYEALGSITGESVGEDLVNEIFSKFCTGK